MWFLHRRKCSLVQISTGRLGRTLCRYSSTPVQCRGSSTLAIRIRTRIGGRIGLSVGLLFEFCDPRELCVRIVNVACGHQFLY